jgi:uncharacterized protein (DUF849 family)
MGDPVIIEVAINGGRKKEWNPNVPTTPAEVTADILACMDAGAAIVHTHPHVFGKGPQAAADAYLEGWLPALEKRPDALIYPTLDFYDGGISYDHLIPLYDAGVLRIGILDPGSLNLGRSGPRGPEGGFVYGNSFDLIGKALDMQMERGLGPSMAIYEPGFLRAALAYEKVGRMPKGAVCKFYLANEQGISGSPFGLPPTVSALNMYREMMGDSKMHWAISLSGGDITKTEVGVEGIKRGGHMHCGLEFYDDPVRKPSNVDVVREAVALCRSLGREPATPDQAAEILGLPPRKSAKK